MCLILIIDGALQARVRRFGSLKIDPFSYVSNHHEIRDISNPAPTVLTNIEPELELKVKPEIQCNFPSSEVGLSRLRVPPAVFRRIGAVNQFDALRSETNTNYYEMIDKYTYTILYHTILCYTTIYYNMITHIQFSLSLSLSIYIYIYIERERERDRFDPARRRTSASSAAPTSRPCTARPGPERPSLNSPLRFFICYTIVYIISCYGILYYVMLCCSILCTIIWYYLILSYLVLYYIHAFHMSLAPFESALIPLTFLSLSETFRAVKLIQSNSIHAFLVRAGRHCQRENNQ